MTNMRVIKLRKPQKAVDGHAQSSGKRSNQNENSQNRESGRRPLKSRKLIIEDSDDSNTEETVGSHMLSKSISSPIWRGDYVIDGKIEKVGRLEAHLSTKACPEVRKLASLLPTSLHLERLSLLSPEKLPSLMPLPTDENIHFYFFEENGSNLLDIMINETLPMRAIANDADLFLYSSHQLWDKYQKKDGKRYLWAMLFGKSESHAREHDKNHILIQDGNTEFAMPSKLASGMRPATTDIKSLVNNSNDQVGNEQVGVKPTSEARTSSHNGPNHNATEKVYPRISEDLDEATTCRPKTPIAATLDVQQRTPNICDSSAILLDTTLNRGEESVRYYSPDRTSGCSLGMSVLHVLSALEESTMLDENDTASNSDELKVGQYFMKSTLAPMLRRIINKQGDIARDCRLKSRRLLTSALEDICITVQTLETVHFTHLRQHHLTSLESAISDGEELKLDVRWLRQRYTELKESLDLIRAYKNAKDTASEVDKEIEIKKKCIELKNAELEKLKAEIHSVVNIVNVLEEKSRNQKNTVAKVGSACKKFCHKPLMAGLL